jgi:hypothetical protein
MRKTIILSGMAFIAITSADLLIKVIINYERHHSVFE